MPIDYFVWVIRNANPRHRRRQPGSIRAEAARRDRRVTRLPSRGAGQASASTPSTVEDVVITHLHYDHAGTLGRLPSGAVPHPGNRGAVHHRPLDARRRRAPGVFGGPRGGAGSPACSRSASSSTTRTARSPPGVTVHRMPGHTMGMQSVRVPTRRGWVLLASDASHYYEHWVRRVPFAICWSRDDLLESYRKIRDARRQRGPRGAGPRSTGALALSGRRQPRSEPTSCRLDEAPLKSPARGLSGAVKRLRARSERFCPRPRDSHRLQSATAAVGASGPRDSATALKASRGQGACSAVAQGNSGVFAHAGRPLPSFPRSGNDAIDMVMIEATTVIPAKAGIQ